MLIKTNITPILIGAFLSATLTAAYGQSDDLGDIVAKGATVPEAYTLKIDKHGNRAYDSPDGKNYILVN